MVPLSLCPHRDLKPVIAIPPQEFSTGGRHGSFFLYLFFTFSIPNFLHDSFSIQLLFITHCPFSVSPQKELEPAIAIPPQEMPKGGSYEEYVFVFFYFFLTISQFSHSSFFQSNYHFNGANFPCASKHLIFPMFQIITQIRPTNT